MEQEKEDAIDHFESTSIPNAEEGPSLVELTGSILTKGHAEVGNNFGYLLIR